MSNAYTNAAKKLTVGHPIAKAILLFLSDGATDAGFWHFGDIEYIANILELGESTVRKYLAFLADPENQFIEKKKLKKKNGYQLLFEPYRPKKKVEDDEDESDSSPLRQSVDGEFLPLPQSGESKSHRYNVEFSPLQCSTATTERLNIYLKGFKTNDLTSRDLTTPECVSFPDFYKKTAKQICVAMKVFSLPNEPEWKKQLKWAFENKYSPEDCAECYRLLLNRKGRIYPVTAQNVINNLPFLTELRLQNSAKVVSETSLEEEYEDCDDEAKELILQNFIEGMSTETIRESLKFFSQSDRAWFYEKLNLEEAA